MAVRTTLLGMNVSSWNSINPNDISKLVVDTDELSALGIKKVRIGGTDPFFGGASAAVKAIALFYKSKGFYVSAGLVKVPAVAKLTAANWPTHRQHILDFAQWAEDNGLDEFMIGNEEVKHIDGTTLTEAQCIQNYIDVARDVQQIYNGVVNYSIVGDKISTWAAYTLTEGVDVDRPSINIYGSSWNNTSDFEGQIQEGIAGWGNQRMYVSEWNLYFDWTKVSTDSLLVANEVAKRIKILDDYQVEHFFFVWKNHNVFAANEWNHFALLPTTGTNDYPNTEWTKRQMFYALFDQKYITDFSQPFQQPYRRNWYNRGPF